MRFYDPYRFAALLLAVAVALCIGTAPVHALDGIALELGTAASDEDVDRFGVAFTWDWGAQWFADGDWYLGGYWELGASYWDGDKGRTGNDSLGDFHVTPVLRLQRKPSAAIAPFLEFGVGAHVHTDDSIGNKNFDIPFAFGSHVGGGFRFGASHQYELLYRFQHLSNAGLGDDNPGINFHVLHLGYRF
jgi:lipid A 3-O-deacylase